MSNPGQAEVKEVRGGDINMRMLVNRTHGHMRIMDFRVGNYKDKRLHVDGLAKQEGLRKAFILVEKQDSHNWKEAGFFREGIYPSFFRTADGYTMSRLYDEQGDPLSGAGPVKPDPDEQTTFPGRKLRKPGGLKLEMLKDQRSRVSLWQGFDGELRALPFSRTDVPDMVLHARARRREAWVLAEIDDSFGHATLGVAPPPSRVEELVLSAFACNSVMDTLHRRDVSNLFGLSPVSDRWSNELFAGLGFKVTGRLANHLRVNGDYETALIWHCRLSERSD
jgi:hypothetical protein